jgi:uncharacterized protein
MAMFDRVIDKVFIGIKLTFVVALVIFLSGNAWAIEFPPKPKKLVNDFAGILKPEEIQSLENKLVSFNDTSSNQITVVIVKDLQGYEVADYAVQLGNFWGVGQSGKKNGIVFLIAPNERKVTIQTGYGLEPVLPDILAGRIIREQVTPAFRSGNYYAGIDQAIDAIILYTGAEFKADSTSEPEIPILLIVFIFILLLLLFAYFTRNVQSHSREIIRGGGRTYNGGGWYGGTGGSWGGGSSGGSGGGGGFGGFGGGSFGGGGASGSW